MTNPVRAQPARDNVTLTFWIWAGDKLTHSLIDPYFRLFFDPWFKQLNISQDQFLPWVWKMQSFHGRVWDFIQEYDTTLFAWNKDAFKAAGLDPNRPPRTIAELDADAAKLTKFDANGNLLQAGIIPWTDEGSDPRYWAAMFGGNLYDQDKRRRP